MVQSYSWFWRADYEKSYFKILVSYIRLAAEIVKSLVEVLYSFIEQARNSGRHDGGLASVEWKNCSPLIENIEWNSDEPFLRNPFEQYLSYGHLRFNLVQNWS